MPKFYKKGSMEYVQSHWGKDFTDNLLDEISFPDLEEFFVDMMKRADWILDDQTWNDMEMNRVFCKLNRAYSAPGQQMLYNMLRTLIFDEEELKRRDRMIDFFLHNREQREKIACLMFYLGKVEYDGAASLLFKGIPQLPDYAGWAVGLTAGMAAALISIPFMGLGGLMLSMIMFIVNTVYHQKLNARTEATIPGVRSIARMLIIAQELGNLQIPQLEKNYGSFFRKCVKKCAIIKKKAGGLGAVGADPIGILEYAKILFLTEDRAFIRCLHYVEQEAPVLRVLYRKIGELDAFMSVASFRRGLRRVTKPVFVKEPRYFKAENIVHPLLVQGVPNTLEVHDGNVVITGSNMSGKSTFLRTLAAGAVMAQTFYTVVADSYEASFFNILTSISPSDDLMEGKSYYMAEAEALLRMVQILEEDRASLLLIDEIFRGTNPIERVAAASSLLSYLARHNTMVIVATHDIEITQNVAGQYTSYHFSENVTKDSLDFDYKLKPGILKVPNGIRILEYLGYPEEITDEAYRETGYIGLTAGDDALEPEEDSEQEIQTKEDIQ